MPRQSDRPSPFPPGVDQLDHTADIGMTVQAESLSDLFDRAALGALAFLTGTEADDANEPTTANASAPERSDRGRVVDRPTGRVLELEADDVALLLVAWLREILFVAESEGLCYSEARFEVMGEGRLVARVFFQPCASPIREIKGVTYHGLEVEFRNTVWRARVIFDV